MTRRQRLKRALTSRDTVVAAGTLLLFCVIWFGPRLAALAFAFFYASAVLLEAPGLVHRVSRLHLDPGDKILVEVKGHVPVKRMDEMARELRKLFPANHVILVGRGVFVSRHIPPRAPARCSCATLERAFCGIHGDDPPVLADRQDKPMRVRRDPGAMAAADKLLGHGYDRILICSENIGRWPSPAFKDADLVLAGDVVVKDRQGPAPRPLSQTEHEFAVAFGQDRRAILIERRPHVPAEH